MKRTVLFCGKEIEYELVFKNVKNINLRIKHDGSVVVSANKRVSAKAVDGFVVSKAEFIEKAQKKIEIESKTPQMEFFPEQELKTEVVRMCKSVYPYFEKRGVGFPQIKFRKMVSQWGNCRASKGVLTFSTNLRFAPPECVKYVVLHEFTHFLQANHSKLFYAELEKVCPDWKERRKQLKEIKIR